MESLRPWPLRLTAALIGLVVLATANLSGIGIGSRSLLYDAEALPRFVVAATLIAAAWATWWIASLAGDSVRLRVHGVWLLLGGLSAWSALSAVLSPHRLLAVLGQSERLEGAATVVLYALAYGLGLQVVRRTADVRMVLRVFVGASALLAAYGVLQFLGIDPADQSLAGLGFSARRAFATFGNPNFFAALLVVAGPCAAGLALDAKRRGAQVIWLACAVLIISALFVSFTRAAWVAAAAQAVVGIVVWRRAGGRVTGPVRIAVAVVIAALIILAGVSLTTGSETNVADKLVEVATLGGSVAERTETARIAVAATLAHPVFGAGPDAFLPAFRIHRSDAFAARFGDTSTINNAHSWPLQFSATTGVPGALLLIGAIAWALGAGRTHLKRTSVDGPGGPLWVAVWVGCAGYGLVMLGGVAVIGATIPFWLLLGMLGASSAHDVALALSVRRLGALSASAIGVVALASSVLLVVADATFLASRDAYHSADPARALLLAERAHALNPTSVKYDRGAAQSSARIAQLALTEGVSERSAYVDAAADRFSAVLLRHPADYPARAWLAAFEAEAGIGLDDPARIDHAAQIAVDAGVLDRQNAALEPLLYGVISPGAISGAASVPALP